MPELLSDGKKKTDCNCGVSTCQKMKEVVCLVPLSWDFVPACFLDSWTNMTDYANGRYRIRMVATRSPYLDSLRDLLVKQALAGRPDYILWLDADQRYPAETPEKLMKHIDDGKLVVGGVTPHRGTGQPMVYDFIEHKKYLFQWRSKNNHLHGIQKVSGMGMGGVMVDPKVYRELLKPPFFQMSWDPVKGRESGEDVVFYKHCEKAGIDVWCDYDLLYKHMAQVEIGIRWDNPDIS